eukprot:CAMPEP_0176131328 /NCGR_PEP_ID=MMETSP0120_2-20121206/66483_1 /TAXON_ID=160619 /ORGANISM="Kryptoperidinium foliaceum, Strain CCMP 1326" /LENGTH=152 /DNA_ID=CAMNT_0017466699 /DNA_START=119 /DNA_END=575 /DNA_ORIENTATION=+
MRAVRTPAACSGGRGHAAAEVSAAPDYGDGSASLSLWQRSLDCKESAYSFFAELWEEHVYQRLRLQYEPFEQGQRLRVKRDFAKDGREYRTGEQGTIVVKSGPCLVKVKFTIWKKETRRQELDEDGDCCDRDRDRRVALHPLGCAFVLRPRA